MKKMLEYRLMNSRDYAVYGAFSCIEKDVVIPSMYKGMQVKRIGVSAFANNQKIESIQIPEGVVSIGENAFKGCCSLRKVLLPSTLEIIENNAFEGCCALTELNLSHVQRIGRDAFGDSGVLSNEENWRGGLLVVNHFILGCRSDCDFYTIEKNDRGVTTGAFDSLKKIEKVRYPDYDERRRLYDEALHSFWVAIGSAPVEHPGDPPIEFFERKIPICIQYEGTLDEWKMQEAIQNEIAFPMIVCAVDGTKEIY